MKKITAVATAGLAAISLSVALIGCGSSTKTETKTSTSTSTSTSTKTTSTSATQAAGPNQTIQDYLKENNIQEAAVHRGDPGSPTIDLPFPPDWSDAGQQTPEWAYGAIVYDKPEDPSDPPSIIAQKTVVIPGSDGLYVLQMNADALDGQEGPLMDATNVIGEKTTITP